MATNKMAECLVCGEINTSEDHLTFHRFPMDRRLRNIWIATLDLSKDQLKNLTADSYICSEHFNTSDFLETPGGQKCLKPEAVPSLFMEADEQQGVKKVSQKKILTFDDMELEHFRGDIELAEQCWKILQYTIAHNSKRSKSVGQRNLRLRRRLDKLNSMWKLLENQNTDE